MVGKVAMRESMDDKDENAKEIRQLQFNCEPISPQAFATRRDMKKEAAEALDTNSPPII